MEKSLEKHNNTKGEGHRTEQTKTTWEGGGTLGSELTLKNALIWEPFV